MYIKNIDIKHHKIDIAIPLTSQKGKTRIKKRSMINAYGMTVSTRQTPFSQDCYVEWQIGYDVKIKDKEKAHLTTIKNITFIGSNKQEKYLYELSEYIYYFYQWGIITSRNLKEIKEYLLNLTTNEYLDVNSNMLIKRSSLINKTINGFNFLYTKTEYPLIIYKFKNYEIITEIATKEKQYAIGIQPMLYFCFPITELNETDLLGRVANKKEVGTFTLDFNKAGLLLELLKMFGILTENHCKDVINIINIILGDKI